MKSNSNAKSKSSGGNDSEQASQLRELFIDELKDIYWAEKALIKALPKMVKKATTRQLKSALEKHLAVTERQAKRVEDVFASIGEKASAKKCEAMAGLVKEAEELMKDTEEGVVRDAAIISAAQKVEHYEIASYGTLRAFAKTLGLSKAEKLLEQTLNEEKDADESLTQIAEAYINIEAAQEA